MRMRRTRYGRRRCPSCGASVTTNALGRAGHERGFECLRDSGLRREIGELLFKAKRDESFEDELVRKVVALAEEAPARLKGKKSNRSRYFRVGDSLFSR
jgi:hypothetical protein